MTPMFQPSQYSYGADDAAAPQPQSSSNIDWAAMIAGVGGAVQGTTSLIAANKQGKIQQQSLQQQLQLAQLQLQSDEKRATIEAAASRQKVMAVLAIGGFVALVTVALTAGPVIRTLRSS